MVAPERKWSKMTYNDILELVLKVDELDCSEEDKAELLAPLKRISDILVSRMEEEEEGR